MHPSDRFPELFARHVVVHPLTGCWEWNSSRDRDGYGKVRDGERVRLAHRRAYELAHGVELDKHTVICHRCDNPRCVNPEHLEAGTQAENLRQARVRGRRQYAFTARDVWAMRVLRCRHGASYASLFAMYGRHRQTVRDAVEGRTYEHVPHPHDHPPEFVPAFSDDGRRVLGEACALGDDGS